MSERELRSTLLAFACTHDIRNCRTTATEMFEKWMKSNGTMRYYKNWASISFIYLFSFYLATIIFCGGKTQQTKQPNWKKPHHHRHHQLNIDKALHSVFYYSSSRSKCCLKMRGRTVLEVKTSSAVSLSVTPKPATNCFHLRFLSCMLKEDYLVAVSKHTFLSCRSHSALDSCAFWATESYSDFCAIYCASMWLIRFAFSQWLQVLDWHDSVQQTYNCYRIKLLKREASLSS